MRSKSKRPGPRLLIFCGRGFAATAVLELLPLLTQAGFEPRLAFLEETPGWVPVEAAKRLSGASPFLGPVSGIPDPAWVAHPEPFVATIALGLPRALLHQFATGSSSHPALELMTRRGGPVFVWMGEEEIAGEPLPDLSLRGVLELRVLPKHPGQMRSAVERAFAEFTAARHRRFTLGKRTFSLRREVPEALRSLAGSSPAWCDELHRRLRLIGMQEPSSPTAPDLLIDLYEGPFPVQTSHGALQISFAPEPVTNGSDQVARLRLRFLHPEAPPEAVQAIVASGVITIIRSESGDLTWHDAHGKRLLPDLLERPALGRFVDLLADRLSATDS